ncbi:transglutaminase-like domain-containing protein [Candidatus Ventrimonas sp. KK005]
MRRQTAILALCALLSVILSGTVFAGEGKVTGEIQERIAGTLYRYSIYGQEERPQTGMERKEYGPGGKRFVNITDLHVSRSSEADSAALSAIGPLLRYGYFTACLPEVSLVFADGEYQTVQVSAVSEKEIEKETEFFKRADEIIEAVADLSEKDKAMALAGAVMDICEYDRTLCKVTAYDCLMGGRAVCIGYADAYYHLCKRAGLSCRLITGVSSQGESHAWNGVFLDGAWYYFDLTWEDIRRDGSCLMCTEAEIHKERTFGAVWAQWEKRTD